MHHTKAYYSVGGSIYLVGTIHVLYMCIYTEKRVDNRCGLWETKEEVVVLL